MGRRLYQREELEDFYRRFKELVDEVAGGKRSAFAREVGLPDSTVQSYFVMKIQPTADKLIKIAKKTGVNLNWLLLGEGPRERFEPEFVVVPRIEVRLGAGGEAEVYDVEEKENYAFRRDWLLSRGNPKHMRLMTVVGDSMEPTLSEGDLVLVDLSKTDPRDGIYALRIHTGLVVKRVQRMGKSRIRVISDNPKYPPQEFDLESEGNDLAVIGKVIWLGRSL